VTPMQVIRRLLAVVILLPAALLMIAIAIGNRQPVRVVLDPFNPDNPAFAFSLPFYLVLFAALLIGVVVGGASTWLGQGRHRRAERRHRSDLRRLERERDELRRRMTSEAPESGSRAIVTRNAA